MEQGLRKKDKVHFILIGVAWAITLVLADHWFYNWTGDRLWTTIIY